MKILLVALSAVVLTACQSSASTEDNQKTGKIDKHSHVKGAGFTSPGKPSAPINMKYTLQSQPKIGQPLDIEVLLNSTVGNTQVNAKMSHSEKLGYSKVTQKMSFKAGASQSDKQVITVIPQAEGIYYVDIMANVNVNGVIQSKAFLIPVEVGNVDWDAHLKTNGVLKDDGTGSGGKVISMPAQ